MIAGWSRVATRHSAGGVGLSEAVGEFADDVGGQPAGELGQAGVDQRGAGHGGRSSRAVTVAANSRQVARSVCSWAWPAWVSR